MAGAKPGEERSAVTLAERLARASWDREDTTEGTLPPATKTARDNTDRLFHMYMRLWCLATDKEA